MIISLTFDEKTELYVIRQVKGKMNAFFSYLPIGGLVNAVVNFFASLRNV